MPSQTAPENSDRSRQNALGTGEVVMHSNLFATVVLYCMATVTMLLPYCWCRKSGDVAKGKKLKKAKVWGRCIVHSRLVYVTKFSYFCNTRVVGTSTRFHIQDSSVNRLECITTSLTLMIGAHEMYTQNVIFSNKLGDTKLWNRGWKRDRSSYK